MPGTPTAKHGLPTMAGASDLGSSIDDTFNSAMAALDGLLAAFNTDSPRPAAGKAGRLHRAADGTISFDTGTSWVEIAQNPHAARHAAGGADPLTITKAMLAADVPVPPISAQMPYGGTTDPGNGWLLAEGRLISTTTYPAFLPVVGHAYNGGVDPGGGQVRIPDKRGRVSVGADNMGTARGAANRIPNSNRALGQSGGEERHVIVTAELPSHTHGVGTLAVALHSHSDGTLAVASHTHAAGTLVVESHSHTDGTLAVASHTHLDGTLAVASHNHTDGTLAVASHTHSDGTLAVADHAHGVGSLATGGVGDHVHGAATDDAHSTYNASGAGQAVGIAGGTTTTFYRGIVPVDIGAAGAHSHSITGATAGAAPDVTGATGAAAPDVTGATGSAAPDVTGETAAAAPDVTGTTGGSAPAVGGATAAAAPDVTGTTGDTAPALSGATAATGGGGGANVMQPYEVDNWIVRVA